MHCVAGVSRSASIVCAYLMVHEGLSLEEARQLCKKQRPCTRPNESFLKQLKAWSATLRPPQQATQAVPYSASAKENHPAFGHQPPRPFMPPGSEFAAALMGARSPMRSPTKSMGLMPPQGLGVPLSHSAAMGMGGPCFSPPQKMAGKGGGARFF